MPAQQPTYSNITAPRDRHHARYADVYFVYACLNLNGGRRSQLGPAKAGLGMAYGPSERLSCLRPAKSTALVCDARHSDIGIYLHSARGNALRYNSAHVRHPACLDWFALTAQREPGSAQLCVQALHSVPSTLLKHLLAVQVSRNTSGPPSCSCCSMLLRNKHIICAETIVRLLKSFQTHIAQPRTLSMQFTILFQHLSFIVQAARPGSFEQHEQRGSRCASQVHAS